MEMISLLNLSITKSRYNASRLSTLAKEGKTAEDHIKDELKKMDKDFKGKIDLEIVVGGLESVHLTMTKPHVVVVGKPLQTTPNKKPVEIIDLDNEDDDDVSEDTISSSGTEEEVAAPRTPASSQYRCGGVGGGTCNLPP